jgi:hypothetical protein
MKSGWVSAVGKQDALTTNQQPADTRELGGMGPVEEDQCDVRGGDHDQDSLCIFTSLTAVIVPLRTGQIQLASAHRKKLLHFV